MLASAEYQGLRQGERMRKPPCDLYLARLPPGEFQAGYQEVEGISLGYLQVDGRRMFALAQVLSDLFKDIPRTTISKRMESLRIKSRRCDLRELRTLKAMQSLPSRAVQGSLISREDLAVLCQEARRRRRAEPAPPLPLPGSKQGTSAGYSSDSDSSLEGSSSSDSSGDSSSGDEEGAGSSDSDSGDSVQSTRYRQAALPEPEPSLLRLSQHLWARSLQGQPWGAAGRGRGQAEAEQGGEQGSAGRDLPQGHSESAQGDPRSAAKHLGSAAAHLASAKADPRSASRDQGSAKLDPRSAAGDAHRGSAQGDPRSVSKHLASANGHRGSVQGDPISATRDLTLASGYHRSSQVYPRSPARDRGSSQVDPRSVAVDRRAAQVDPSSPPRHMGLATAHRRSAHLDPASPARDVGSAAGYRGSAHVDARSPAGDLTLAIGDRRSDERDPQSAKQDIGSTEGYLGSAEIDLRPSKRSREPTEEEPTSAEGVRESSRAARGLAEVGYARPLSNRGLIESDLGPAGDLRSAEEDLQSAGRDLGSAEEELGSDRHLEPAARGLGSAEAIRVSAEDVVGVRAGGCVSPWLAGDNGAGTSPSDAALHPKSPSPSLGRGWEPGTGSREGGEAAGAGTDSRGVPPTPCSPPRDSPEPRREHFDRLIRQSKLWCYAKGFSADGKGFRLALAKPPSSKRARSGSTSSKKAFKGSGSERNARRRRLCKGSEPERQARCQPGRKRKSGPRKKSAAPAPGRRAFSLLELFPCTPSLVLGPDGDLCPAYSLGASSSAAVPKPHPVWRWQLGGNAIPVPPSLKFRGYPWGHF